MQKELCRSKIPAFVSSDKYLRLWGRRWTPTFYNHLCLGPAWCCANIERTSLRQIAHSTKLALGRLTFHQGSIFAQPNDLIKMSMASLCPSSKDTDPWAACMALWMKYPQKPNISQNVCSYLIISVTGHLSSAQLSFHFSKNSFFWKERGTNFCSFLNWSADVFYERVDELCTEQDNWDDDSGDWTRNTDVLRRERR